METNKKRRIDPTISPEEYNAEIKKWTYRLRAVARKNLASHNKGTGQGARDIQASFKYELGEIFSTGFKFLRHLVYLHYGVGRGYVRQAGIVVRGHRDDNMKFMMYRGKPARTWHDYTNDNRALKRRPINWLDAEIEKNLDGFVDIVAERYGDKAAEQVVQDAKRFKIEKE